MSTKLAGLGIIEKDTSKDVLLTWCYPGVTQEEEEVLIRRSQLQQDTVELQFFFSRLGEHWQYFYVMSNTKDSAVDDQVETLCLWMQTTEFSPEIYGALLASMAKLYLVVASPPDLLRAYLSVYIKGSFSTKVASFKLSKYDARRSLVASSLKDVVLMFGAHSVLLWHALLLRKRVVVYADQLDEVLSTVRALPLFVWHRQDWSILRPFVADISDPSVADDLASSPAYIVGVTDASVKDKSDLYDVYVDIPSQEVVVSDAARADFAMTKLHKDLSKQLVAGADDDDVGEQTYIKAVASKTGELIKQLQSIAAGDNLTMDALEQQGFGKQMQRFMYNVALCEGMTG